MAQKDENQVKKDDLGLFERTKQFLKSQSEISICLISLSISGYLAYRYLNKKHLMMEYHGHFNSPQNMINKRLTVHYVKDAAARFGLGFIFFAFLQLAIKYKLNGFTAEEAIIHLTQNNSSKSLYDDLEEEYI